MNWLSRCSSRASTPPVGDPPVFTQEDLELAQVVRKTTEVFDLYCDRNKELSGVTEAGLKEAIKIAKEGGYVAPELYLEALLKSRDDPVGPSKDDQLLNYLMEISNKRDPLPDWNQKCEGVSDAGLNIAINLAKERGLKVQEVALTRILQSKESQHRPPMHPNELVGKRLDLDSFEEKAFLLRALSTSEDLKFWKPIKKDGDHYYRAVMFGLLEWMIQTPENRQKLFLLVNLFEKAPIQRVDIHHRFVGGLREMAQGMLCQNVGDLKRLIHTSLFGKDMVSAARGLLSSYVLRHKDQMLARHKISEEDAGLCLLEGVDLHGPILKHGLLGDALHINLQLISLDKTNADSLKIKTNVHKEEVVTVRIVDMLEKYGLLYL